MRYHTLVLTGNKTVIFHVISFLPFSAKNVFVTVHLLESSLARFKNVACCFQTILCLLSFKEGNEWISAACFFSPLGREQEVHKCIHPKHSRVSDIKSSNVVTKETSHEQILLQTLWHLRKPQINLVSL